MTEHLLSKSRHHQRGGASRHETCDIESGDLTEAIRIVRITAGYIYLPCARCGTSSHPVYVYISILKKAAAKEKEVPSETQMVIKTFTSSSDLLAFSHDSMQTCLNAARLRRRHLLFFSLVPVREALPPSSHFRGRPDTRRNPTEAGRSLGLRQTTLGNGGGAEKYM